MSQWRGGSNSILGSEINRQEEDRAEDRKPEKLIDEDMVFKAAMSSNYSQISDLAIVKEDITRIDSKNAMLCQMSGSLRKFDLSFNELRKIENLD